MLEKKKKKWKYFLYQLELPDKGRAIKGLVVCNNQDISAFGPTLLSTVGIKQEYI